MHFSGFECSCEATGRRAGLLSSTTNPNPQGGRRRPGSEQIPTKFSGTGPETGIFGNLPFRPYPYLGSCVEISGWLALKRNKTAPIQSILNSAAFYFSSRASLGKVRGARRFTGIGKEPLAMPYPDTPEVHPTAERMALDGRGAFGLEGGRSRSDVAVS